MSLALVERTDHRMNPFRQVFRLERRLPRVRVAGCFASRFAIIDEQLMPIFLLAGLDNSHFLHALCKRGAGAIIQDEADPLAENLL